MLLALTVAGAPLVAPAAHAGPARTLSWLPRIGQLCQPRPALMTCNVRVAGRPSDPVPALTSPAGYFPADLQRIYRIPRTAAGERIAVISAGTLADVEQDLAVFRSTFRLPACTTASHCLRIFAVPAPDVLSKALDVAGSPLLADDTLETALDIDAVSGMCPECPIDLVNADGNINTSMNAAVEFATRTLHDRVISNSYYGGEAGASNMSSDDADLARQLPPGTVMYAASGDGNGGGTPTAPGDSPRVISVGGTSVVRSGQRWLTTAWVDTTTGCSKEYPAPSWQRQSDTGCAGRAQTDVSALADPDTGIPTYVSVGGVGGWVEAGGTSLATPLLAAMTARLHRGAAITPQTFYRNAHWLLDVTSGSTRDDSGNCSNDAAQECDARHGWDGPTGNGTPIGPGVFLH